MTWTGIAANAGDATVSTFLLAKFDFAAVLYLHNSSHDLLVTNAPAGGTSQAPAATWVRRAFTLSGATTRQAEIQGATIELANADNYWSSIAFGATIAGVRVHVWEAWFNPATVTAVVPDSIQRIEARIASLQLILSQSGSSTARIILAPTVSLPGKIMPRRRITAKCSLDFKGPACQANGTATTCDHSLTACTMPDKRSGAPAGGNKDNFGGYVFYTSLGH
jgi:hypothetical protein